MMFVLPYQNQQNFLDILQSFPKISYSANTLTLSNNKLGSD